MDDDFSVGVLKGPRRFRDAADEQLPVRAREVAQLLTVDELHRAVASARVFVDLVNRGEVGVLQKTAGGLGLALEAGDLLVVAVLQEFQRDPAAQHGGPGLPHLAACRPRRGAASGRTL